MIKIMVQWMKDGSKPTQEITQSVPVSQQRGIETENLTYTRWTGNRATYRVKSVFMQENERAGSVEMYCEVI